MGNNSQIINELQDVIDEYGKVDTKLKAIKRKRDKLNKKIKELMSKADCDKIKTSNYEAIYSVRHTTKLNEDILLRVLEENKLDDYIVRVKKPDVDKLHRAVQENTVDPSILSQCVESKSIQYLTVKKRKED